MHGDRSKTGGEPTGKCTPSTSVSVTATSSRDAGGITTAPSSPTPMRTSARSRAEPREVFADEFEFGLGHDSRQGVIARRDAQPRTTVPKQRRP